MNSHVKLTLAERKLIGKWIEAGLSLRECARRLGRSHTTVVREVARNKYKGKFYEPLHAHFRAQERKGNAWCAKHPLKNKEIYNYATKRLKWGWSPEVIAGRLKFVDHPQDPHWSISPEAIYQFCYNPGYQREDLIWCEYLRRKQKKRRKQTGRRVHRLRIPDRVSIHERPESINNRTEFGHWEGDTVEGKAHRDGVHTEVERLSRLIGAKYVKAIDSQSALNAQLDIFTPLPQKARRSTTLDNGRETHLHFKLRDDLDMETYHADPYSSWQRGTNENGNGLLRCYFPKGTDFSKVTQEELEDVIWELNNRPRKILEYKTAQEVFNYYLLVRS